MKESQSNISHINFDFYKSFELDRKLLEKFSNFILKKETKKNDKSDENFITSLN